jgi:hemerythrin
MALLEWKFSYSVGVKELDQQHEVLLKLINGPAGENPDHVIKRCFIALNDLVKYTELHSNTEENLMRLHGFIELPMHQKEHEAFIERVFELNQELADGNPDIFGDLVNFLKDWFISDVLGTDIEYKDFLAAKGVT